MSRLVEILYFDDCPNWPATATAGAGERHDFALACRVYRTDQGFAGLPPESWIRAALAQQRLE